MLQKQLPYCNTEFQKTGLTVQKVQAVTGHKSEQSTETYTHFNPLDFGEAPKIQGLRGAFSQITEGVQNLILDIKFHSRTCRIMATHIGKNAA